MSSSRILLVEDNPDHQELTLMTLADSGVPAEVVVANDGLEAMDYLFGNGRFSGRDANDVPSLVLLDLKLPKLSGVEVLRQIRSDPRTRFVPVVILTSSHAEEDILKAYNLNVNCYITKPVDLERFIKAVRSIEDFWLSVVKLPAD